MPPYAAHKGMVHLQGLTIMTAVDYPLRHE